MDEQNDLTIDSEAPPREQKRKKGMNGVWAFGLIVGVGIAFGGAFFFDLIPSFDSKEGGVATIDPASVVAMVNNVQVTRAELDKKVSELKTSFPEGAVDPAEDAAFELQVLDEVINLKILLAEVEAQGIVVTDAEIDAELATLVSSMGGEEALQTQLTAVNLTKDELKSNIKNEIAFRTLFEKNTAMKDIQVSDEEIRAMYDEAVAQVPEGQEIPPLSDVSDQARSQLIQQKSGILIQEYISTLREKANIEVLL